MPTASIRHRLTPMLLLPALARAKKKAQRINCVNNLKQVGLAFRLWGGDNDDKYPPRVPEIGRASCRERV